MLPKRYACRELTPALLGGLIDTFSRKDLAGEEHKGLDVLGRVYEYFLGDLKPYEDAPGFCATVALETIREHQHVLNPGRYVGSEAVEDDGEPLDEKIARLTQEIRDGFAKRAELWRTPRM